MSEQHRPIQFLWAIDNDAPGGMVPLPASPLLFPAILGMAIWSASLFIIQLFGESFCKQKGPPPGVPLYTYERYRKRFYLLNAKKAMPEGLSVQEHHELHSVIMRPPWSPNVPYHY